MLTWVGRVPLYQYIAILAVVAGGLAVVAWHFHWYAVVVYATAVYSLLAVAARRARGEFLAANGPDALSLGAARIRIACTMLAWKAVTGVTFTAVLIVKLYLERG